LAHKEKLVHALHRDAAAELLNDRILGAMEGAKFPQCFSHAHLSPKNYREFARITERIVMLGLRWPWTFPYTGTISFPSFHAAMGILYILMSNGNRLRFAVFLALDTAPTFRPARSAAITSPI